MTAGVVPLLQDALGALVDLRPASLNAARADRSGHRSAAAPLAVVHARSVADVQAVMRIATLTDTPVVIRGAGTGLAGAGLAGAGSICLSLAQMDRIREIRPDDQLAVVEPGVINADLNAALAGHGLWWAPDPASREISTVGGNIATGAGGLLCAKYGVVRDAVLGVDVVLADGELVHFGHRTVKGVTGYDLTALMIGSEGTLGVVVGATLRLRPLVAGAVCTVSAAFADVHSAAAATSAVSAAGIQPAILELMDAHSVRAVHDLLALVPPPAGTVHVTAQTDGAAAPAEAEAIADLMRTHGAIVEVTADPQRGAELLHIRRSMHPAMAALGTTLIEDVAVPRSRLADMFDEIARIERDYDLLIPVVAHAGDGNLHPNFIFDGPEVPDRIWDAAGELFRSALRLGGTLTGEHGVGILKSRWLREELGERQWRLQRDIKAVFDPRGILAPGAVFADTGPESTITDEGER